MKEKVIKAINEKQHNFFMSNKKFLLLSGAVGAGKSLCGCAKGFMLNMKYPGNRGLIIRKAATSLRNSTIRTLLEQIIPSANIESYNQMTGVLRHYTGDPDHCSEIVFCGLDKGADQSYPTKIGSTEYGWIFFDEGVEGTKEDWDMLASRLRFKIPHLSDEENNKIPRQIFTATNPDGPNHWMYKFFFVDQSDDREYFLTTPYDNPKLTSDYIKTLENMYTGLARDRLLLGKWVQAEGVIYKNFDRSNQVNDTDFLEYTDYKELIVGADANYPIPRAAVLIGIRGNGRVDVLEEFYRRNAHVEDLCAWLEGIYNKLDRTLVIYHDPSDPEAISKIGMTKGCVCYKANNKVLEGISAVARYFDQDLIRISPTCVNLINELQSYCWEVSKEGDKPKKENDHIMDALRYALYSYHYVDSDYQADLSDPEGLVF